MDETSFRNELGKLISEIETLPSSQHAASKDSVAKAASVHQDLATSAKGLAETLDNLRLQIKYLVFDLEATRRENAYLRKMLESRPPQGDPEEGEPPA